MSDQLDDAELARLLGDADDGDPRDRLDLLVVALVEELVARGLVSEESLERRLLQLDAEERAAERDHADEP